ncbi:hypothetical protein EIP91_007431 [Steccherinum ochraceum]|uniref:Uncharacterized protein n=1 Tax=Steccherinum ochraceum TaxID=92696 RepID=A0A4R0RLS3_9APHY|nr:hypothetical protein EIP91_007431 [Steccherinum ochraceum]
MTAVFSFLEARWYYYGLPSRPFLVARTDCIVWEKPANLVSPWDDPVDPEAYPMPKEIRSVSCHKIGDVWENKLAPKLHAVLNSNNVDWTSTDVVRIGYVHKPSESNTIVWIGVEPSSLLPFDVGIDVALQCKNVLLDLGIDDVEVEIRESTVISLGGSTPDSLEGQDEPDRYRARGEPFTSTLDVPVCSPDHGKSGICLTVGGASKRPARVTIPSRHAVHPAAIAKNVAPEHTSGAAQARLNALLCDDALCQQDLTSFDDHHRRQGFANDCKEQSPQLALEKRIQIFARRCRAFVCRNKTPESKSSNSAIKISTSKLSDSLPRHTGLYNCILRHLIPVVPSSLVSATGPERYPQTQDIAVVEIDTCRIDPSQFKGNVIDVYSKYSFHELLMQLRPLGDIADFFDFLSVDGVLNPQNTDEMCKPTTCGPDDTRCIFVQKNGYTVGRANPILSFVRRKGFGVSKEWAILFSNGEHEPHSGSVVVDLKGRIEGILHSRCGSGESADMTYAYVTPASFILDAIRGYEPLTNVAPKPGPPK